MTIHWCGTGLSAIPGLRRLIEAGRDVVIWNRTLAKAEAAVGDIANDIRAFELEALTEATASGDIVVSMLPGDWHVPLAEICIGKRANFVSSSYIAPEMRALEGAAKEAGVVLVNEVGLDPGIDHLMAHVLVNDYRKSVAYHADNQLSFISYCGGVPKLPNPFRYKFSWSPLGVLKALRSPSKSIRDFKEFDVTRPWDAISSYTAPLPTPEAFEVYPNRDSLPFIQDYDLQKERNIKEFVRGTLRLNGWKDAWANVFAEIETLSGPEGGARLAELSEEFWAENAYDEGEPDRVVLCVALKAERDRAIQYHKTYVMDAWGTDAGTAMARLVSVPVSLAVEAVSESRIAPGVHAAPNDLALVQAWLNEIDGLAQHLDFVDHLAS
ncbi:MAG: saccharopine dehydrogenase family protein [Pseudomonadota bacterium]